MGSCRILVTGASGFVGRHLVPKLQAALPAADIHTPNFDITDATATEAAVRSYAPDVCVHLAAVAAIPVAQRNPDKAWKVNLHGTLNLAYAILTHAPDCHFLFVSSADAYGATFRSGTALDEGAVLAPLNVYSATKAASDLAIGALSAQGLRAVRVRPFNHTGPGQGADFVVAAFARQVARIAIGQQDAVLRVGTLDTFRDFLDVRDVCAAYIACIIGRDALPPGTILNIASGTPRRIGDVLDGLLEAAGVTARVEVDPNYLRPIEIKTAAGNATRARELLGWSPQIPWEETLNDVLMDWKTRVAV